MATVILKTQESDPLVSLALARFRRPGDTVITVSGGLSRLHFMAQGDTLKILGYGYTTKFGGYTAADLARLLSTHGLPSGLHLELVSCFGKSGVIPYAVELKAQLVSNHVVPQTVSAAAATVSAVSRALNDMATGIIQNIRG